MLLTGAQQAAALSVVWRPKGGQRCLTTSMGNTSVHDDRTTSAARKRGLRSPHAGCASPLLHLVAVWECVASCVHRGQSSAYDLAVNDDTLYPPFAVGDSITDLTRRMGGISEGGTVALVPGWDWEVIMCGIAGAIARYQDGLGKSKGIAARAAVGEGLWWSAAADEFLRKRVSGGMSLAAYSAEIQKTSAGRRLAGLVFLRNRAGHQLAAALMQYYYAETSVDIRENDGSVRPLTIVANALAHLSECLINALVAGSLH